MTEIKKLAEAAQNANAGPWFVCRQPNDDGTVNIETGRIGQSEWNPAQNCEYGTAEYIAAASPDVVLALIAERDDLRAELARLKAQQGEPAGYFVAVRQSMLGEVTEWAQVSDKTKVPLYRQAQPAREPMTQAQRRLLLDKLGAEWEGADGDSWDNAVIEAIEAFHGIKEKS